MLGKRFTKKIRNMSEVILPREFDEKEKLKSLIIEIEEYDWINDDLN